MHLRSRVCSGKLRNTAPSFSRLSLTIAVAEVLLRKTKQGCIRCMEMHLIERRWPSFCICTASHGPRRNTVVKVGMSALDKLTNLCRMSSPVASQRDCIVKHKEKLVACVKGVVYRIPLSCDRTYVGHMERWLNDQFKEYSRNVTKQGHLVLHCRDCGCALYLDNTAVLFGDKDHIACARLWKLQ